MRVVILRESGSFREIHHLYHFAELLVVAFVELAERRWARESVGAVVMPGDTPNWKGTAHDHNLVLLRRAFPNATVSTSLTGPRPPAADVLTVDRALLDPGNTDLPHVRYIHRFDPYTWYSAFQGGAHHNRAPVVTYVSRQRAAVRRLHPAIHERLVSQLGALPDITFREVYMEDLGFEEQLEVARNTDVLLGAHGKGLTHALFMRPRKAVCEIFGAGAAFHAGYYSFSKMMGHDYVCMFDGSAVSPSRFHAGPCLCRTDSLDILDVLGLVQQAKEELLPSRGEQVTCRTD